MGPFCVRKWDATEHFWDPFPTPEKMYSIVVLNPMLYQFRKLGTFFWTKQEEMMHIKNHPRMQKSHSCQRNMAQYENKLLEKVLVNSREAICNTNIGFPSHVGAIFLASAISAFLGREGTKGRAKRDGKKNPCGAARQKKEELYFFPINFTLRALRNNQILRKKVPPNSVRLKWLSARIQKTYKNKLYISKCNISHPMGQWRIVEMAEWSKVATWGAFPLWRRELEPHFQNEF